MGKASCSTEMWTQKRFVRRQRTARAVFQPHGDAVLTLCVCVSHCSVRGDGAADLLSSLRRAPVCRGIFSVEVERTINMQSSTLTPGGGTDAPPEGVSLVRCNYPLCNNELTLFSGNKKNLCTSIRIDSLVQQPLLT
jgi:hypothetical protein